MSIYIPNFAPQGAKKPSKYHNEKVEIDGHMFDSKTEAARYRELQVMQRSGAIKSFNIQPSFVLTAGIRYRPDFIVWDGKTVWVEDVKGMETKDFKLKAKLFRSSYPYLELKIIK